MTDVILVTLPGGLWVENVRHREALVRPLRGADEEFLLETGAALSPAARTTALLARCVTRVGPVAPVPPEVTRSLTLGDREALLLHLRRVTFGDRLPCVVSCPACGERMDLDLSATELLVPPYAVEPYYERPIAVGWTTQNVRFRLPGGADQELAAEAARHDPARAVGVLLERCVEAKNQNEWTPEAAEQVGAAMSELDPQAEIAVDLVCPACRHRFSTLFDTANYLYREMAAGQRHLHREVHLLAFHYHWSEQEILSLTPRKRRLYLEMLAEALGGEGAS